MEDFRCHFDNFTSEMHITAYRHFIETDREYKEVQYYINKHEKRFNDILKKLNEEDKKFVTEYIDKKMYKASCSSNELYIIGYKDCIKLLRELEVI